MNDFQLFMPSCQNQPNRPKFFWIRLRAISLQFRLNIGYHVFLISICPYRSSAGSSHHSGIPFTDGVGQIDVFPKLISRFPCIADSMLRLSSTSALLAIVSSLMAWIPRWTSARSRWRSTWRVSILFHKFCARPHDLPFLAFVLLEFSINHDHTSLIFWYDLPVLSASSSVTLVDRNRSGTKQRKDIALTCRNTIESITKQKYSLLWPWIISSDSYADTLHSEDDSYKARRWANAKMLIVPIRPPPHHGGECRQLRKHSSFAGAMKTTHCGIIESCVQRCTPWPEGIDYQPIWSLFLSGAYL